MNDEENLNSSLINDILVPRSKKCKFTLIPGCCFYLFCCCICCLEKKVSKPIHSEWFKRILHN